jgi:ABC-type sugar transport system permease subunit
MRRRRQNLFILSFLAPPLSLYALFVLLPAVTALRFSLTRWDGLGKPVWVGLKNFVTALSSGSGFPKALENNLFLMFVPSPIILTLALFFAYCIHQRIRGSRLFRIAFFFPNVISSVAVALLWILIYSTSQAGLLNNLLRVVTHRSGPIPFADHSHLYWAMVPMMVWSATGFYMVLFLAAMENIPESYSEAARLDGASPGRLFFSVTLPLMWDVLTVGIVFLVIGGLKAFDTIWVMENGRPTTDTHSMSTLMYSKVFEEYNIGYGSAIAVLLFLLVLAATLVSIRLLRRERLEY